MHSLKKYLKFQFVKIHFNNGLTDCAILSTNEHQLNSLNKQDLLSGLPQPVSF